MLDLPTLRLATLRRLVSVGPPPLVFPCDTPIEIVEEALWELPFAKVVVVDPEHALCGVLVANDLPTETIAGLSLEELMDTRMVFLAPEHDVEAALTTLRARHAEHVVVSLAGELLGVVSRSELERANLKRAA